MTNFKLFQQNQASDALKSFQELEEQFDNMTSTIFELENENKEKDDIIIKFNRDLEQLRSSGGGDFQSSDAQLTRTIRVLEFENLNLTEEKNFLEEERKNLLSAFVSSFWTLKKKRLKIFSRKPAVWIFNSKSRKPENG